MGIEEHRDEIDRCNKCGFCQTACPIFRATGHESGVARGRVALLRALLNKRIDWDGELEEPLFNCLLCGACTANCFPAVGTADLLLEARSEYLEKVGRGSLHRLLFKHLLPYPKRLRIAARGAALGKNTGLSKVAKALGLLRIFGRDFPNAEGIVERFPKQAFRDSLDNRVFDGDGELRLGFFIGCGNDIMCPDSANSTLSVLRQVGKSVEVLDNCCCGLPPMTYGDREASAKLAAKNLKILAEHEFDLVVTDCSSCASFLKKYPELFAEDDPLHAEAKAFSEKVRDFSEMIDTSGDAPALPAPGDDVIATYHDPCHAVRGQGLAAGPREILKNLPNVEFREMPEADWCCGGAGSYALGHYKLSRQVLDRKMDNLERSGANLLVTSCPACIIQLSYGIRLRGLPVRVCHISELVAATEETPVA